MFGSGELDLVVVPGYVTHVELMWEHEPAVRFFESLASFARVIAFDRRGSGMSDRVAGVPTLEQRMDDVRAVMDAAGSERAALLGISEGVPMSILFAATYPHRVQALVSSGGMARSTYAEDYPWALPAEALVESGVELILPHWGDGSLIEVAAPSQADNPEARAFFGRMQRATASPGMMRGLAQMFLDLDVREVVPTVHAPVLVLHRVHDRLVNVRNGRWLAEHLPNARLVELEGDDHVAWYERTEEWLGEVQEFLTGSRAEAEPERILSTVLVTEVVDSESAAAEVGVQRWRGVLQEYERAVRASLERFRGREVSTTDGRELSTADGRVLATFDGPARAIRCARELVESAEALGIRLRAGVHSGECELLGENIGGAAVRVASRISAVARPSEVLVSRTVKDLVVGSGIEFTDRGAPPLEDIDHRWELHSVVDQG